MGAGAGNSNSSTPPAEQICNRIPPPSGNAGLGTRQGLGSRESRPVSYSDKVQAIFGPTSATSERPWRSAISRFVLLNPPPIEVGSKGSQFRLEFVSTLHEWRPMPVDLGLVNGYSAWLCATAGAQVWPRVVRWSGFRVGAMDCS